MDDSLVEKVAFANLPTNRCAISGDATVNPAVMHRDLSDWWPPSLLDMRDERLVNLLVVERSMRDRYYAKLRNMGVVLSYSGGLDSTTVLHWCLKLFGDIRCLIFDYGQRHSVEVDNATAYVESLKKENLPISYKVVDMKPINDLAVSSLTRKECDVPRNRGISEMSSGIPNTFVPGRNVYFLTALAQEAYATGNRHIAIGVNILDYSGYPDCRPEFLDHMRNALRIGVFDGLDIGIHAPLMYLDKKSIIRLGLYLGVKYGYTHSCYNGVRGGCGECDSCQLRRAAFRELGVRDPAVEMWQG